MCVMCFCITADTLTLIEVQLLKYESTNYLPNIQIFPKYQNDCSPIKQTDSKIKETTLVLM